MRNSNLLLRMAASAIAIALLLVATAAPVPARAAGVSAFAQAFAPLLIPFRSLLAPLLAPAHESLSREAFFALDPKAQQEYIASFAARDPDQAWKYLKEALAPYDGVKISGHSLGHVIGRELYRKYGMEGLLHCSIDFGFACYHGVSQEALLDRGEGAAEELAGICESVFPANDSDAGTGLVHICVHGIGHGIATAEGLDMQKTIARCEALPLGPTVRDASIEDIDSDNRISCMEGAFMEIALDDPAFADPAKAWSACAAVPERYQRACARYITAVTRINGAIISSVPEAVAFCDTAPNGTLRDGCYNESVLLAMGFLDPAIAALRDATSDALPRYLVDSCAGAAHAPSYYKKCIDVGAGYVILSAAIRSDGSLTVPPAVARRFVGQICGALSGADRDACMARTDFIARAFAAVK